MVKTSLINFTRVNKSYISLFLFVISSFTGITIISLTSEFRLTPFYVLGVFFFIYLLLRALKYHYITNRYIKNFGLVLGYFFIVEVFNYEQFRFATFAHTLFYFYVFYFFISKISLDKTALFVRANKVIILLYSFNIIFTYFTIVFDINIGIGSSVFKVYNIGNIIRPIGFSTEPSYAALIISCCLLSLITLKFNGSNVNIKWVTVLYIISILLLRSVYGLICMCILGYVILRYNNKIRSLVKYTPLLIIAGFLLYRNERIENITSLLMTIRYNNLDEFISSFRRVDNSFAMRLLPTLFYLDDTSIFSFKFLFGHGGGGTDRYFGVFFPDILASLNVNEISIGFFPGFLYSYGLMGLIVFKCFINEFINLKLFGLGILLVILMFNANLNTQILWFFLINFSFLSINISDTNEKNWHRC